MVRYWLSAGSYLTFLDVAGAKRAENHPLDGESLLPLSKGEPALQRQAIFFHFPGYLNGPVPRGRDPVFRTRPVSVIRKGDWKLFLYHEQWQLDGGRDTIATNDAVELYHLAEDPGERHNLALRHLDTFDLKPDVPEEIRGAFQPIGTNVPGIEITELLPTWISWFVWKAVYGPSTVFAAALTPLREHALPFFVRPVHGPDQFRLRLQPSRRRTLSPRQDHHRDLGWQAFEERVFPTGDALAAPVMFYAPAASDGQVPRG